MVFNMVSEKPYLLNWNPAPTYL